MTLAERFVPLLLKLALFSAAGVDPDADSMGAGTLADR
jgi:hypothetical protein